MASKYLQLYEGYGSQGDVSNPVGANPKAEFLDTPMISQISRPSPTAKSTYYGGTSYMGGGDSSSGVSKTTTKTVRSGSAPELPSLPSFVGPKVDKRKIKAATQKAAAPGMRRLRETVQQAMGKSSDNPNVRRMTLRDALRGYGAGLENVMAGAGRQATSEHMAELDLERSEAYANFQQQTNAMMAAYNNAWQDYMKGAETVSETVRSSESGAGGQPISVWSRDPVSGAYGLHKQM